MKDSPMYFKLGPDRIKEKEKDTATTFSEKDTALMYGSAMNMGHPTNYGSPMNNNDKPKLDEFGNPIPQGFKSDIKGETGGTAKSKQTLEKEYKAARNKQPRTPSRGRDRKTQFAAAGGDAASLVKLKSTDPSEYSRLKSRTQMQDADFKKLTRLKELEAKRLKNT